MTGDPLADEVQKTLVFIGDGDGTMPVRIYRDHVTRLAAAFDAERKAKERAEAAIARARGEVSEALCDLSDRYTARGRRNREHLALHLRYALAALETETP